MIAMLAMLLMAAAPGDDGVKHITAKEISGAMAKEMAPVLAKFEKHRVMISRRTEKGQSELHKLDHDVFYIVDGEATFTTGGSIVGGKETEANEVRGSGISGGTARRLAKGDVITIPAGTPHWFSEVKGSVTYFIVKVTK